MAIDKIKPRSLNLDDDIRLLEEGDMTDALNVTLSRGNSDNLRGILRSAYGNTGVSPSSLVDAIPSGDTVIGVVNDLERQCIYFFVKGAAPTYNHSINKYTYGGGHETVFKSSWLRFENVSFVKADVLNGNFAQRQDIETILYFTDGKNPPRKINVDRAIAGDYDGYSSTQLDFALNCIKGSSTTPPSFRFENDATVNGNNLKTDSFQFATQFIYKDGEESALSSYSALAASKAYFDQGVGDPSLFGYNENVCKIDTNWFYDRDEYKDVVKVRILVRKGNTGNFVVLDELPTDKNVSRKVFGQDVTIWNFISGVYRFYNDSIYSAIDSVTVNKLYDAVPFTASGQAIAQNRLFFSDYTEFRPNGNDNGDDISASLTAVYPNSFSFSVSSTSVFAAIAGAAGWTSADLTQVDFSNGQNTVSPADIIPANSQISISLTEDYSGGHVESNTFVFNDGFNDIDIDVDITLDNAAQLIEYAITNFQEISISDLAIQYKEFISNYEFSTSWSESNVYGTDPDDNQWGQIDFDIQATIKFLVEDTDVTDGVFIIRPYVSSAVVSNVTTTQTGYSFVSFSFAIGGAISQLSSHLIDQLTEIDIASYSSTFKAGCSHDIGVVYYDEHGRSGFVNKLGNFYAKHVAERDLNASENPEGDSIVGVNIIFQNDAPSWAKSYQIVYTGRNTFSDFTTYTVGQAYSEAEPNDNNPIDGLNYLTEGKLYVSLKTLDLYQKEKSAVRDYSFTPGDKLRVISYKQFADGAYTTIYPKANNGDIIEFDIVDVVTLTSSNNEKIAWSSNGTAETQNEKFQGTFLVIDQPKITQGNTVDVNGVISNLSYEGFDWYQVTGTDYPYGTSVSQVNTLWGQGCVVELLTPRELSEDRPYYEIGERYPVLDSAGKYASNHGPLVTVFNGDVWWKRVACKSGIYNNLWTSGIVSKWGYINNNIESSRINDFKASEDWSKGRAHYVFDQAATFRRYNGITYSDAYEQDVHNLSLSSFNTTLANFKYVDRKYGALNYLSDFNGNIVGIQDNKMLMIPCKSNIIEYADGSSNITMSTDVLGLEQYASGDFGVSKKDLPSVLVKDNQVYFFDRSRNAVLRYAGGQLTPISEKKVKSFFRRKFDQDLSSSVVSGYDPMEDVYYFTKKGGDGFTISYNVGSGRWQSFHSFVPENYAFMNDTMFTFRDPVDTSEIYQGKKMWAHTFLGITIMYYGSTSYDCSVEVYSKLDPSKVKVFNAVSYETDDDEKVFDVETQTNLNGTYEIPKEIFSKREGVFYSNTYKKIDTYSLSYAGLCTSTEGIDTIIVDRDFFSRHAISLGSTLYATQNPTDSPPEPIVSGENLVKVSGYGVNDDGDYYIDISTVLESADLVVNKHIYLAGPEGSHGSHMRGHWMRIKLSTKGYTTSLYCVNTHIAESKLTHSFNQ
jgi:hypothetical protein